MGHRNWSRREKPPVYVAPTPAPKPIPVTPTPVPTPAPTPVGGGTSDGSDPFQGI
jgi:hypothetical protein